MVEVVCIINNFFYKSDALWKKRKRKNNDFMYLLLHLKSELVVMASTPYGFKI